MTRHDERGFTLVETMIAIFLFSILSIGFYQVMFSTVRGSNTASDVSKATEEARLGFNRMIRDTREATLLVLAEDDRYRIWTDFDRDGLVDEAGYEYMEYEYDEDTTAIYLTALEGPAGGDPELITGAEGTLAGTERELLAELVAPLAAGATVFVYSSNFLIYDTNNDGETDVTELEAGTAGANDGVLTGVELDYVSDINYAFVVQVDPDDENPREFYGQAQIRNRRFSDL